MARASGLFHDKYLMFRKTFIVFFIILTGCTSPKTIKTEKPVILIPPPICEMMIAGKCKAMTASEKSGATSLGNKLNDEE